MIPKHLQQLREALEAIDKRLRADGTCTRCHLPTSGLVPHNRTVAEAGICTCDHPDFQQDTSRGNQ